jgi:hypothetical protein
LLAQDLGSLELEVLICNNSTAVHLRPTRFTRLGRLLRRFRDVKVFNSSHNWLCRIRYTLGTLARHPIILFLDDDVTPLDRHFVTRMVDLLGTLGPNDIISCWTALWTRWDDQHLTKVRMNFLRPETTEVTECDYAGPGVCMFNKHILFNPAVADLPAEHHRSDSAWFPWVTAMELGSRKFYMPSYGLLRMHPEYRHAALAHGPGFRAGQYAAYRRMWKRGYVPVMASERQRGRTDTPEAIAARTLRPEVDAW